MGEEIMLFIYTEHPKIKVKKMTWQASLNFIAATQKGVLGELEHDLV